MNIFTSDTESHQHSLQTLNLLANYHDFMDSIDVVCDMGCGAGMDISWWASRTYIDENGVERPYNYMCLAVDTDTSRVNNNSENLRTIKGDFETKLLSRPADLMWSHDSFRYAINPLATLKVWNEQINTNGMLTMIVPQTVNITYNKLTVRALSQNYYHYTITNLLYMLAVNGFDCHDGHFVKYPKDPWIHCVVYKSEIEPMDPKTTTWYDLADKKLLPQTAINCIDAYGFLKQEELQTHWLNGQFCNWNQL